MKLCENNSLPVIAPMRKISWDMRMHQVEAYTRELEGADTDREAQLLDISMSVG